jgi:hypothetical protein
VLKAEAARSSEHLVGRYTGSYQGTVGYSGHSYQGRCAELAQRDRKCESCCDQQSSADQRQVNRLQHLDWRCSAAMRRDEDRVGCCARMGSDCGRRKEKQPGCER